jgi:hypothetical protein
MQGTFEVHLITNPNCQTKLFGYIVNLRNTNLIRPRPTCAYALCGDYPIQPMLTFWINGQINDVKNIVMDIEYDMIKHDIPIIRTKIESLAHNKGVPNICDNNNYFEFHFKSEIVSTKEWNEIVKLITPFGGHLFYNPYNKTLNPIVTIRRYTSLDDLEITYDIVKTLLENNNYKLSPPEKEYSVYDSNMNLDKNWLFKNEQTNFITEVDTKMLFA